MSQPHKTLADLVVPHAHWPWKNYTATNEALAAIDRFSDGKGRSWAKLAPAAAGPEVDDAPQRAIAQLVLRAQNEVLMRIAASPEAPVDAIDRLIPPAVKGRRSSELNQIFAKLCRVDVYSHRYARRAENVLDVRNFGFGQDRYTLLDVFDAAPEHPDHLAARESYQYAPITIVASRRNGGPVAVAVIKRAQTNKGERFYYLVESDGDLPTMKLTKEQFPDGTLIRHLGYEAPLYNAFKENSVQGVLDRTLPGMKFPVGTFYHDLGGQLPRTESRLAVGSLQHLAWLIAEGRVSSSTSSRVLAEAQCEITRYEFEATAGGEPATKDTVRHHCRPNESGLFISDGQTVASIGLPKSITKPTLITVDVSRFSRDKLHLLRADRLWRVELINTAVGSRKRTRNAPAQVSNVPLLVDTTRPPGPDAITIVDPSEIINAIHLDNGDSVKLVAPIKRNDVLRPEPKALPKPAERATGPVALLSQPSAAFRSLISDYFRKVVGR
jgi:hypothetical protein